MDSLHGQLGRLLNDAQALLADIAPGASGSQFGRKYDSLNRFKIVFHFILNSHK